MKTCPACKKHFLPSSRHKNCPACRFKVKKNTCADCNKLINRQSFRCSSCAPKARQKPDGGQFATSNGYIYTRKREHPRANAVGYVFEHIIVMEDHLKRYLVSTENVHHINGVKHDNRIENLELWSRPQPSGARVSDLIIWAKEILLMYGKDDTLY